MNSDPASQGAALAGWFDDSPAPEEVQALRAWVAGLSAELRLARGERDEARQALAAARAEIARLQAELAALREAGAPIGAVGVPVPAAATAALTPRSHDANEPITVESLEACAASPVPPPASVPEPASAPSGPDAPSGGPTAATNGTVAAAPTLPLASPIEHDASSHDPRRLRLLAAALVVLAALALLVVAASPRFLP